MSVPLRSDSDFKIRRFIASKTNQVCSCPALSWARQAQFEGHIETRCRWARAVELHAREVVNGVPAFRKYCEDAVQPSRATGDFQGRPRRQTKCGDACDVSQEERLELRVVRKVEKYGRRGGAI